MQLSWKSSDIAAIYYINDTLSGSLRSLERAARAYADALRVQRWLRTPPWLFVNHSADSEAVRAYTYYRRTEPLPVLQYRISRKCFDGEPAWQRQSSRVQKRRARHALLPSMDPMVLQVPSEPPTPGTCLSRTHACEPRSMITYALAMNVVRRACGAHLRCSWSGTA